MTVRRFSQPLRFCVKLCAVAVLLIFVLNLIGLLSMLVRGPLAPENIVQTLRENCEVPEKRLTWQEQHFLESGGGPFKGAPNFTKKFLTIGVTTVYRKEEYLRRALKSLVDQSWPEERQLATIVIFLADRDLELRNKSMKIIEDNFSAYIDSGFIQVIIASPAIYPALDESIVRKRDETLEVILWRTKQLVDASFLFSYVSQHNMSDYHVIVEDDTVASNQYITAIRDFVTLKGSDGSRWGALQFTIFACIGITFRSHDLRRLADFLLFFYDEKPYDLLILVFIAQEYPWDAEMILHRNPGTFQHLGVHSSLRSKLERWTDDSFGQGKRFFQGIRNPSALRMSTTLQTEGDYVAENSYSPAPGWFNGRSSDESDTFDILYAAAMAVDRVIVLSGLHGVNKLVKAELLIGSHADGSASFFCPDMTRVGDFHKGHIDAQLNGTQVQCIQIRIQRQLHPIIIREIKMMGSDDERPERFTPAWPPRSAQKPLPNIFTRCSDSFKKVTWPPEGYEEPKDVAPPPSHVPLLEDIPLNPTRWTPTGTYKASPTVYAEEPEDLDTAWPPPEPIDTSEKVIYDAARPKKVIRDFTVHFKGSDQPTDAAYKVPPGTLHVLSKRGVLSYNTPELGSGRPKDPSQKI